ncbi:DNA-binding protein [Synergistales bacterium]|nr:DNA-binding protein [Synergistales bacterium]
MRNYHAHLKDKPITEREADGSYIRASRIRKNNAAGGIPGKTLIIDVDRGTSVLPQDCDADIVRLDEDLSNLKDILTELQDKCEYDNIAVDSLSELERGMLTVLGRLGKNNGAPELVHYQQADFKLIDYCRQFRSLDANIIFTAWESLGEVISTEGEKYTQARPMLRNKTVDNVCGLCDVVGEIVISAKDGNRYVRLSGDANTVAKDRVKKRQFCIFEELI